MKSIQNTMKVVEEYDTEGNYIPSPSHVSGSAVLNQISTGTNNLSNVLNNVGGIVKDITNPTVTVKHETESKMTNYLIIGFFLLIFWKPIKRMFN